MLREEKLILGMDSSDGHPNTGERRNYNMPKKEYVTPDLTLLGSVEEITKGTGILGNSDQFRVTIWGHTFTVNYGHPDSSSGR